MIKLGFLIAVTVLYVFQVGVSLWYGDKAAALIVFGYVVANIGLVWSLS